MAELIVALFLASTIVVVSFTGLVTVAVFHMIDRRGRRRCGKHGVRSKRTTCSSRGQRPYRGGRVRL